jgi:SAM-dependent methyltransferase
MPRDTDHFSKIAASYARFRPDYPDHLLDWVADASPARRRAWDCGAGSGQASLGLARRFDLVVASDLSASQLAAAPAHERVHRVAARAESAALASASCDAVVVAQALHWFDLPAFHAEASRVLVRGGLLAAWSYGLLRVEPETAPRLDAIVRAFYRDVLGPHWPAERRLVDDGYRDIAFPAPELEPPTFHMAQRWTLAQLVGYVRTWSAVRSYRTATGDDPVPAFARELGEAWGDPGSVREVRWPLVVRAARIG